MRPFRDGAGDFSPELPFNVISKMVRGRGFEPLNPYGTRFPNIVVWMFLSFAYTWCGCVSRL